MPPKQSTNVSGGASTIAQPTTSSALMSGTKPPTSAPSASFQEVIENMPQFSKRLENAMKSQLGGSIIEDMQNDPLYASDFDPIDYINAKFPTEDSVQNGAVQLYIQQTKHKITSLQSQIRQEIRVQASTHSSTSSLSPSTTGSSSPLPSPGPTSNLQQQLQNQNQPQSRELLDIVQSANKEVVSLFDQIKTIKQTAAPSEQLVAQICVDISALDLAKRHLQRTSSGLRNLHMLISTTTHLAEAVHSTNYQVCVTLIDSVDGLVAFFEPYKHLEKIKIIQNQIRQLKRKICDEASLLIRKTVILNIPAHTVESFPPNSDKAKQYRDALQVIKLVDPKLELELVATWCESVLSPYVHIFTKNQESIGLQHIDRRLAWFRRELKRCLPIYDHIFPHGYNIWSHLLQQFCNITKDHLKSYMLTFSKVSYYDIINTSGIGHTTYVHDDSGRLLQIRQGRKKSTMVTQHGQVPVSPLHIYDEAILQRHIAVPADGSSKRGFLGSIANWAEQYTNELKSPTTTTGTNPQQPEETILSLDDFDNDVAIPQISNQQEADPVLGKVSIANERNIPLMVNAVSKCLTFEKEMVAKIKSLDTEHGAQKQYQRYAQPFIDLYNQEKQQQQSALSAASPSPNSPHIGLVQPPTQSKFSQGSKSPGQDSSHGSLSNAPLTDKIELTSVFEPYMYNLVIVERHSLLNLINQSLASEHWVPSSLHAKPRYPSCDQLLYYIKRSIDNISRICNTSVLVLLFIEYVTSLRHYVNILTVTSDLPYLKVIPSPYVHRCGIALVPNPSGSTISGLFANPNNIQGGASSGNSGPNSTPQQQQLTLSLPPPPSAAQSTSSSRTTALLNTFSSGSSSAAPFLNPGQQHQHQQHGNLGTVATLEQFVRLCVCFNTCEHIADILPSFIAKLKEKLDDSAPLPPTQQDELDIQDYAEQSLQYIKQNIYVFSAYRLFQELSMLPYVSWSPNTAANNPLTATSTNPSGKPSQLTQTHRNDLLFGSNSNAGNDGDVNIYALSTSKYIKFFTAYAHVLFSPAYYGAYVKYLAQRLFPDILACILLCRSISQPHAQQMVIDIYTVTFAIHNIYNYQLDITAFKQDGDVAGMKPGMAEKPNATASAPDEILSVSTSVVSPNLLQSSKDKQTADTKPASIVQRYPLVDIPANTNVATIRIFLRFVKKEISLLESYTKVISSSTANNIANTISIFLGDDCSDETVLSLFNVIGVPLVDQKFLLQKYHDTLAQKEKEEEARIAQEQQDLASAQGRAAK